jgi:hypothetical protein
VQDYVILIYPHTYIKKKTLKNDDQSQLLVFSYIIYLIFHVCGYYQATHFVCLVVPAVSLECMCNGRLRVDNNSAIVYGRTFKAKLELSKDANVWLMQYYRRSQERCKVCGTLPICQHRATQATSNRSRVELYKVLQTYVNAECIGLERFICC